MHQYHAAEISVSGIFQHQISTNHSHTVIEVAEEKMTIRLEP